MQSIKIVLLLILVTLGAQMPARGQDAGPGKRSISPAGEHREMFCTSLSVSCPSSIAPGLPLTFTANISGEANSELTYTWTVSKGVISGGQGTPTLTVDTTGLDHECIKATIEVKGFRPECSYSSSGTTLVIGIVDPRRFDSYHNLKFKDEKAHLDNLAIQLNYEPDTELSIVAYEGRNDRQGVARQHAERARKYLMDQRGIEERRIHITADVEMPGAQFNDELTLDFYILPHNSYPSCEDKP